MSIIRYADQVNIGDEVFLSANDKLTKDMVINVSSSMMQGNNNFLEDVIISFKQGKFCTIFVTLTILIDQMVTFLFSHREKFRASMHLLHHIEAITLK